METVIAVLLAATAAVPAGEMRAQNEAAALALHHRLDANRDGFVTYREMRDAAQAMVLPQAQPPASLPNDPKLRAEFDRADSDHDGRISPAEAIAGADRTFADADTDHDGVLTLQERGAYAALALAALERETSTWKPLPCSSGAACATAHRE